MKKGGFYGSMVQTVKGRTGMFKMRRWSMCSRLSTRSTSAVAIPSAPWHPRVAKGANDLSDGEMTATDSPLDLKKSATALKRRVFPCRLSMRAMYRLPSMGVFTVMAAK